MTEEATHFKAKCFSFFYCDQNRGDSLRTTVKVWREILLAYEDGMVINARTRDLIGKTVGCGVVEVSLKPLENQP